MYKVYVNGLVTVQSSHCYAAILINGLHVPSPSFVDDISLLTLHPVTFGETKPHHCESLKNRQWLPGDTEVEQLYECKNLGVLKNYVGHFPRMLTILSIRPGKKLVC